MLVWRTELLITDTYTVANTLVAVANGHLWIDTIHYGPHARLPGMHIVDGQLYGRNYGQVFLTLPLLWLLTAATTLVGIDILLSIVWAICVGACLYGLLPKYDYRFAVSSTIGVSGLVANVLLASPGTTADLPVIALQFTTMLATASLIVVMFGLVRHCYTRQLAYTIAGLTLLASPVLFWGTLPKRHSFTALFVLATVYSFRRSRDASADRRALLFRAGAYIPVGLLTWIHAPEGLILFCTLGLVDVLTARSNSPHDLLVVGSVFGLALVPFFLTNTVIAGNPLNPPRALLDYRVYYLEQTSQNATAPSSTTPDGPLLVRLGEAMLARAVTFVTYLGASLLQSVEPTRLGRAFLLRDQPTIMRSGQVVVTDQQINASVLASMPLLGGLLAVPARLWRQRRALPSVSSLRATDWLCGGYLVLLCLIYLPRLPIHTSYTVRYLHPLFPLGLYLLCRIDAVRSTLTQDRRLLSGVYVATTTAAFLIIGMVLTVVAVEPVTLVRFLSRAAFGAGVITAYWFVFEPSDERVRTVVVGITAALTTVFLLANLTLATRHLPAALPIR